MKKPIVTPQATMNKLLLVGACVAVISAFAGVESVSAQMIGAEFDFHPYQAGAITNTGALGESFVNFNAAGPNGNNVGGLTVSQVLGQGVTLTVSTPNQNDQYTTGSGYEEAPFTGGIGAYDGSAATNPDTLTFTLSGLTPFALYNVAAYAAEVDPAAFSFNNGLTYMPVTGNQTPGDGNAGDYSGMFIAGENYVSSPVNANASGDIVVVEKGIFSEGGATGYQTYYAKAQGIGVSFVSDVPEPGTWALVAGSAAVIGSCVMRRRRA